MSKTGNKYKVGALALAAFAILIGGLVALGAMRTFRHTYRFMTIVSGSVQGLNRGAKVKIKGVTIGSVEKIQLGPDMKEIYVYMRFDPDAFSRAATPMMDLTALAKRDLDQLFGRRIDECVANGMRCQLQYGDITGTLFVDIAFFDPKEYPVTEFTLPENPPPYIPAVPTATIGTIIWDTQKVMENVAQVDFRHLADEIIGLAAKINQALGENNLPELVANVGAAAANVERLTDKVDGIVGDGQIEATIADIRNSLERFNAAVAAIESLAVEADQQLQGSRVKEMAEEARVLITTATAALRHLDGLQGDLRQGLDEANATMRSARTLLDQLERNPDSLIYGKPGEPVVPPR